MPSEETKSPHPSGAVESREDGRDGIRRPRDGCRVRPGQARALELPGSRTAAVYKSGSWRWLEVFISFTASSGMYNISEMSQWLVNHL